MSYVPFNDDLKRKKWMREGLLQKASKSFWTPYTGMSSESVIYQVNNEGADSGHTVVFQYEGSLSGRAIKDAETAYGKGENKKVFSNKITVNRYRMVAFNGDKFDAREIASMDLSEHEDSRSKLGDLFIRFKDQAIFDSMQGLLGQTPTHIYNAGTTFDYNALLDIETMCRTGTGFTTGSVRSPLRPFTLADGRPVWMFVVDSYMAKKLKQSTGYQSMIYQADIRGSDNRALSGVIGKVGSLLIVEAPVFAGYTANAGSSFGLNDSEIEISGMRRKDAGGKWTGQPGYVYTGNQFSRGLLVGQNSVQLAFGKQPDYSLQFSQDFGISSESCVEFWMNLQKTVLNAETEDMKAAKVANIDWGVIAVDVQVQ